MPSKALGVDPPDQQQPDKGGDVKDGGEGKGGDGKGGFRQFWDWFTGKVNSWWDKVTGTDGGDSDGGDDDPEPDFDPNE